MRRRSLLALCGVLACLTSACGRLEPFSTAQALDRLRVATSKVYDAKGNVIADLHGEVNRDTVTLAGLPKHVQDAVIAAEDERFWLHQGIDVRSIGRAILANVRSKGAGGFQGGSTISQQLAKNLYFPNPARKVERKVAEARVTFELERQYTKSQILEMYLNTIYLGRGTYGIETAAHSYFGKSSSQLSLDQSAFLAGLIHEPARYEWAASDPPARRRARIADAKARRDYVLERMRKLKLIDRTQALRAERTPLTVLPPTEQRWTHPYFVDAVLRQLGVLRGNATLLDPRFNFLGTTFQERSSHVYVGGLRIYTTLDPSAQAAAEKAIADNLPKDIDRLSAALVAIEPSTGYVRALVGGRDYYPKCPNVPVAKQSPACRLAKLNLALGQSGGGSGRQPGSSFKPFVLATALERGISLYQSYPSSPFDYSYQGGVWTVNNYEGEGGGGMTLVDGTAHSVNAVFAHLEIDGVGDGNGLVGASRIAPLARRMGVGFPTRDELKSRCGNRYDRIDACLPADDTPALALGAKEVSPLDMAVAYSAFANDGVRVEPTSIVRIDDAQGHVLYRAQPERLRAIPSGVARGVTYALQQVVKSGTGTAAALDRPAAGKTGTSERWTNAWFDGFVPQLTAVVWVGNAIPVPGVGLESMTPDNGYPFRVVGGTYPAMIWHDFMSVALNGVPARDFAPPPSVIFNGGASAIQTTPTPSVFATLTPGASGATGAITTVPSVIGMNFGDAENALDNAGFRPDAQHGCDPSGRAQMQDVYAQQPAGGSQAPAGSTVVISFQGAVC